MKKFVCSVCGYVYEGEAAPAECPICHAPAEKFKEQAGEKTWAAEHVVGVAQGAPEDIMADLRANFEGECSEVGMYLAMARVAHREGYPEIGLYWEKAAFEEAEHAAKFAELLGEVVTDSTEKNLQMRVDAENGATAGKFDLAKRAKALNLDAIHDTVHEIQTIQRTGRNACPLFSETDKQQPVRSWNGQAAVLFVFFTFALHGTAGAVSGTAGRMLFHRTERGKQRDTDQCQNQNSGEIHIPCLLMPDQMQDRHSGRQRQ